MTATQQIKERPILFSGEMVRAILDGRKTQTRRVVKPMAGGQSEWLTDRLIGEVPHGEIINGGWQMHHPKAGTRHTQVGITVDEPYDSPLGWIRCPYGKPGEKLWVREAWEALKPQAISGSGRSPIDRMPMRIYERNPQEGNCEIRYKADSDPKKDFTRYRSPIHMPRWASRITLEITNVRVERLQDILEADAIAEGLGNQESYDMEVYEQRDSYAVAQFADLWNKINGKRHPWSSNPWVWVIEFRRIV